MNATDQATVLDLLELVDDHRRSNQIAAVLSTQSAQRAEATAVSQHNAAVTSIVRRGMARLARSHASEREQAQELDAYVRMLVDSFLGEGSDADLEAPRPRKRVAPARGRRTWREGKRT